MRRVSIAVFVLVMLASGVPVPTAALPEFPAHGRFDYQIGGGYDPSPGTRIVTRDSSASTAPGTFGICYLNAFQTQPGRASAFPSGLLQKDRSGERLVDPDWPDEFLLDTTTASRRRAIVDRLAPIVDSCAAKGYRAIEPDNLDTYTRDYVRENAAHVPSRTDNVALLGMLVRRAHAKGLLVAQKNTVEDSAYIARHARTDFAVAEECQRYSECRGYTRVYGTRILEIEYADGPRPRSVFAAACAARGSTVSVILRDRDVVARGRPGYTYEVCPSAAG